MNPGAPRTRVHGTMTNHHALEQPHRGALTGSSVPPNTHEGADRQTVERLMQSFWQGRSPHTLDAYRHDVELFAQFLIRANGLPPKTPQLEALRTFFGAGAGRANELVLNYRNEMRDRDQAPASINRRLAAVRSLVKLGRLTGAIYWSIEVGGVPHELTRDTRGPDPKTVAALITAAGQQENTRIAARDVAMLRITFDLALRVGEVVRLDVADLELKGTKAGVWVLGKGRARKVLLELPEATVTALRGWLTVRGRTPGPLFLSYSNHLANRDARLVTRGAYRIMRNLGARCGIHLHPHMLRHSAITAAVDKSVAMGLSLDQVRDFSRHKNINTLLIYRDRASSKQGSLADAVAETVTTEGRKSDEK